MSFIRKYGLQVSDCNPCDCGCNCASSLEALSGDASFRKYYRLRISQQQADALYATTGKKAHLRQFTGSIIAVDAPPETQKNREFVQINSLLHEAKLLVPAVIAADFENGYMLLEDLGNTLFADAAADEEERLAFYFKACVEMMKITCMPLTGEHAETYAQRISAVKAAGKGDEHLMPKYDLSDEAFAVIKSLPPFDRVFIETELGIFTEWLLEKRLNLTLSETERQIIKNAFDFITESLLQQPQTVMHRDFHCRNIMVTPDGCTSSILAMPAVIDYQDAVKGPAAYDAASLLFDCYTYVEDEYKEYLYDFVHKVFVLTGLISADADTESTIKMIKLCAVQRHIKVLGLFNRLSLRDGKDGYLKSLPFVTDLLIKNCRDFVQLQDFADFLDSRIKGRL